jgi:adenylate cyclase
MARSNQAWAAYQRGVWHFSRFDAPETAKAQAWFERAIELDDRFAPGYYGLALVHLHDGSGYMPRAVPDWQTRGERLAQQAVMLDERDSGALNPSDATAHGTAGATLVFSGRPVEGLEALDTSLRLSPRDPRLRVRLSHIGLGHFFARHYAEAEATAETIMRDWPGFSFGPRLHAMVLAETGRIAQARTAIAAAMALSPAPFDDFTHARMPWYGREAFNRALAAFRTAGWPGGTAA